MDVSRYKDLFVDEATKNLREMDLALDNLEKAPDSADAIDLLFRHAHSIKGMAASMGYEVISRVSHRTEDLMDGIRGGRQTFTPETKDLLYEALDFLQTLVDMVAAGEMDFPDGAALMEKIGRATHGTPSPSPLSASPALPRPKISPKEKVIPLEKSPRKFEGEEAYVYKIHLSISSEAQFPAARALLIVMALEKMGEIRRTHPPREKIEEGELGEANEVWVFLVSDSGREAVEKAIHSSVELKGFEIEEFPFKAVQGTEPEQREPASMRGKKKTSPRPLPVYRKPGSVRVDTPDLDILINIIGEMMIQEGRLAGFLKNNKSLELKNCHGEFRKSIQGIHRQIMKFRMLPITSLVEMLPRVVRDLQRESGKEVQLTLLGKDIRVDRAILEELGDPLLHLARNAIDHGLETPEERKGLGKDPAGKLTVTAWREKDLVFIQIEDDGRGIDANRIKAKAVERGLLSREAAAALPEEEALQLICAPGLSTAERITDISGRGVGMDVVKTAIENFGGSLFIHSTPGQGTKFVLKVPMTLAIVKSFLLRVQGILLAIPLTRVHFVMEVPRSEIRTGEKGLSFFRRGETIPMLSLSRLLKLPEETLNGKSGASVIGVEIAGRKTGLVVDQLLTVLETVIKPVGLPLSRLGFYSGVMTTGTGEMALVLDVERFAGRVKSEIAGNRPTVNSQ